MNSVQINQFNSDLDELAGFTQDSTKNYSESEIIDWISKCVNVFYEIGLDAVIIRHFLDYFSFGAKEVDVTSRMDRALDRSKKVEKVRTIGPFQEIMIQPVSIFEPRVGSGQHTLEGSFYYAKVAFSLARNVLKNKIEEKRIVPSWLTERMSEYANISHLVTSLELIESKYEQRDAHGLVVESITLLQSILNLDPDLVKKNKLGGKLNSLIENADKRSAFGASEDLVRGLNCERILRNEKVVHKDAPLKYELPFMIATSFAYLVLFFVECAILNGKIINYEQN